MKTNRTESSDRYSVGRIVAEHGPETNAKVLSALDAGELVAVPTDTVYGLAARVDRPNGIEALFEAKERPRDLSLPVLIGKWRQIADLAASWPPGAAVLASRFWPGPLTLVVPAIADIGVRLGGADSVGIRWPRHTFLAKVIAVAGPLAVTSANLHGVDPRTSAAEVTSMFPSDVPILIVDGGRCAGVPSTVVDCIGSPARCIREGGLSWQSVEHALI